MSKKTNYHKEKKDYKRIEKRFWHKIEKSIKVDEKQSVERSDMGDGINNTENRMPAKECRSARTFDIDEGDNDKGNKGNGKHAFNKKLNKPIHFTTSRSFRGRCATSFDRKDKTTRLDTSIKNESMVLSYSWCNHIHDRKIGARKIAWQRAAPSKDSNPIRKLGRSLNSESTSKPNKQAKANKQ